MTTEAINHDPAHMFMNTGTMIAGRPSMGAWVTYGLGSEAEDLPGFVVLTSNGKGGQNQPIAARQWSAGFLPSRFQGVQLRGKGDPVLYLTNPGGRDARGAARRGRGGECDQSEDERNRRRSGDRHAHRAVRDGVSDAGERAGADGCDKASRQHVLELYGCQPGDGSFASNCLLARRLAERGVRFIQLYHKDWDHHGGLKAGIELKAQEVDRASAALIQDLKQRDMLEGHAHRLGRRVWPHADEQGGSGRDHHIAGFSMWMAGGGIKGGLTYGATDEFGYAAVEDVVEVHDLHATMLHLLGIEHKRLTYKFQGRDFRLTDVRGQVLQKILA